MGSLKLRVMRSRGLRKAWAGRGWMRLVPLGRRCGQRRADMRGFPTKIRLKTSLFLALTLVGSLSLAACSDIDSMFGDETPDATAADNAAPTAGSAGAMPGALPENPAPPVAA